MFVSYQVYLDLPCFMAIRFEQIFRFRYACCLQEKSQKGQKAIHKICLAVSVTHAKKKLRDALQIVDPKFSPSWIILDPMQAF